MGRRAWIAGLVSAGAVLSVAPHAESVPLGGRAPTAGGVASLPVSPYYLARGDPRMCPSPLCGGLFLHLVNRSRTVCGDRLRRPVCYVAATDLGSLGLSDAERSRLVGLISAGRALVRGTLARGRIAGFPQLDTLVVSEVWPASVSPRAPAGTFRRLVDNGVRCIAAPCFSTDAATLNPRRPGARVTLSHVDFSRTGATEAAQRRASRLVASGAVLVAGRIVRVPDAGPAGTGRALVVSQLYLRAA